MKTKKIRNLVEEHLSQKDTFADDDELEEDSLVKSTVNDLLEGNVDDVSYENVGRDLGGFKSSVFPLEDTFSSKAYSGKKISRKSLEFEKDEDHEASESISDDTDESLPKSQHSKKNVSKRKMLHKISKMSGSSSFKPNEEILYDDGSGVSSKKKVRFSLPSSDSEEATDEDVTNEINENDSDEEENDSNEEDENDSDEEDENDSDNDESEIEDDLSDEGGTEDHSSFLYSKSFKDEPSEVEKGLAIRNQLSLWEVLLESRIMLQKCLVTSNTLPKPDKFVQVSSQFSQEEKDSMIECREKVWDLLEKLILVQDKLRKQNKEFIKSRSEENPEEKNDDDEDDYDDDHKDFNLKVKRRKLSEYPEILEKQYNEYIPYRDSVIQKWNDRTKIASGKFAKSNFSAFDQPILNQIEQIMSDKHRLIQKTYLKRSQYDIFGEEPIENKGETDSKKSNLETDHEIFDDDDFYHKLLRDYIERKTSDISDPTQLGRKWIQLQSLRNKMKRKIDTRRTKGRKIDFKVHPKLVNFMAPDISDRWEENAINELFSSIFGKNLIKT